MISRKSSTGDRRQVELSLTARGSAILEVARAGTLAAISESLATLSGKERGTVVTALSLLTGTLGRAGAEPGITADK